MSPGLTFETEISLRGDNKTYKKVALNLKRNQQQDNTDALDSLAETFIAVRCP